MGVSAQYTGMAGKTANCQIGVFPTYAGAFGEVLVDRELYLPKEWTQDAKRRAGRRARAGDVPDQAAAGRVHDRTLPSIATASQLGDTKGSPSKTVDAAHLTCERSGGQLMCYFLINAYPDRQYQTDSLILCVNLFQCHKMPCSIQGF